LQLEKEISNLQRQRHQLEFVLDSHASRCRHLVGAAAGAPAHDQTTTAASAQSPSSRPFAAGAVPAKVERPAGDDRSRRGAVGRPCSLSLPVTAGVSAAGAGGGGLATTPMTFASLGLDCMVDGHTGLTPITGAPSCSAGGQRPHDDMSVTALHPDGLSPTTLMTL